MSKAETRKFVTSLQVPIADELTTGCQTAENCVPTKIEKISLPKNPRPAVEEEDGSQTKNFFRRKKERKKGLAGERGREEERSDSEKRKKVL